MSQLFAVSETSRPDARCGGVEWGVGVGGWVPKGDKAETGRKQNKILLKVVYIYIEKRPKQPLLPCVCVCVSARLARYGVGQLEGRCPVYRHSLSLFTEDRAPQSAHKASPFRQGAETKSQIVSLRKGIEVL